MKLTKRYLAAFSVCLLCISSVACGGPKNPVSTTSEESTSSSESTDVTSTEDEYLDTSSTEEAGLTNSDSPNGPTTKKLTTTATKKTTTTTTGAYNPNVGVYTGPIDYDKVTVPHYNTGSDKKVTVAIPWDSKSPWVENWGNVYNEIYGGTVEYTYVELSTMVEKLAAMKAVGKAMDVAVVQTQHWPCVINANLAQSADTYIDFQDSLWKTVEPIQNALKYNGKNYFMVGENSPISGVAYNVNTMKSAGLTDPLDLYYSGQWSWDKFLEYAEKLTDADNYKWGVFSPYWWQFLPTCGYDIISASESGYKINIENDAYTRVMTFLAKLGPTQKNVTTTLDWSESLQALRNGKLGMLVTGSVTMFLEDMAEDGTLGYAPLPFDPGADKPYTAYGVTGSYILKNAKNPAAAAEYGACIRIASVSSLALRLAPQSAQKTTTKHSQKYLDIMVRIEQMMDHQRRNVAPVLTVGDALGCGIYGSLYGPVMMTGSSWSTVKQEVLPELKAQVAKLK